MRSRVKIDVIYQTKEEWAREFELEANEEKGITDMTMEDRIKINWWWEKPEALRYDYIIVDPNEIILIQNLTCGVSRIFIGKVDQSFFVPMTAEKVEDILEG